MFSKRSNINNLSKKSQLMLLIGLVVMSIVPVYISIKQMEVKIIKPEYTICEIIPKEKGDTRVWFDAKFEYFVSGVKYSFTKDPMMNQFNILGEKYVLEFDEGNPEEHRLISHKPVFLKEEKTAFVHGKVIRLYRTYALPKHSPKYAIEFQYSVNEELLKKAQHLSLDYNGSSTYQISQKFTIEIVRQNFRRIFCLKMCERQF